MPEATTQSAKAKSKPTASQFPPSVFPGVEAPAAFRDMAEKSLNQVKDNYEKMKSAAEEATGLLEQTYASATKGATDYSLKLIENARTNVNAMFDYLSDLCGMKSASEVVELTTAHARKQFETFATQTRELATLAQKIAAETAEPIKEGVTRATKKAV
jgi:phasin